MKFLRNLIATAALLTVSMNTYADVKDSKFYDPYSKYQGKTVSSENWKPTKNYSDKKQSGNFKVFDSLANCYSYFYHMTNKAFVLEPTTNTLLTIKRGFFDLAKYTSYTGDNTKNNIFLRKSTDNGVTWDAPIKIYDNKIESLNEGRYPSLYGFMYDNKLGVAYTVSRVDEKGSKWYGFFTGFWNSEYQPTHLANNKVSTTKFGDLDWSTDSRILASETGSASFYELAIGRLSPSSDADVENANHIALRKSVDLSDFTDVIPAQWESNKFKTVDAGYRSNNIVDLKYGLDNKIYFCVFGNFNDASVNKNRFGVSVSSDEGNTWTEFNIMPWAVVNNYLSSKGIPQDSAAFLYDSKGFVALNNGDFSIASRLMAWYNPDSTVSNFVEIYYNGTTQQWSIRDLAEFSGSYIVYQDVTNDAGQRLNPGDFELQLSRTIDGKYLVAKWVDLIDFDKVASTFTTTDVFMATRPVDGTKWSKATNITSSPEIDRGVMMANLVPNDLTNIPLLKLESISANDATDQEKRDNQFKAGIDQVLMIGHANIITSINEEEPCDCTLLQIQRIAPNPIEMGSDCSMTLFMPSKGYADLTIYDVSGKVVNELSDLDREYNEKQNSVTIPTKGLNIGTYYLNIVGAGQNVTKMLTIIK